MVAGAVIGLGQAWALIVLLALPAALAGAQDGEALADTELVQALRGGGHVVYFRHGATDWSQEDHVEEEGDWTSCDPSRIRQLSDEGRRVARGIGESMRALGIPVGTVLASPYCRTVETAALMDLGPVRTTADVMNLRVAEYFGGRGAVVARARALLATAPVPGTNTVVSAHGNVVREATDVYPGEGEAIVFRPKPDGGFEFVGRVTPARWQSLAQAAAE